MKIFGKMFLVAVSLTAVNLIAAQASENYNCKSNYAGNGTVTLNKFDLEFSDAYLRVTDEAGNSTVYDKTGEYDTHSHGVPGYVFQSSKSSDSILPSRKIFVMDRRSEGSRPSLYIFAGRRQYTCAQE